MRLQKLIFFGTDFLCKCDQAILNKVTTPSGQVEFISVVQNRIESASDLEILIESFSDEEVDVVKKEEEVEPSNGNADDKITTSPDAKTAEFRRLLRRKDELERKARMNEKYKERLQVSLRCGVLGGNFVT